MEVRAQIKIIAPPIGKTILSGLGRIRAEFTLTMAVDNGGKLSNLLADGDRKQKKHSPRSAPKVTETSIQLQANHFFRGLLEMDRACEPLIAFSIAIPVGARHHHCGDTTGWRPYAKHIRQLG